MRLDLPHDNWAELREPDQIPRKAARQFRKSLYTLSAAAEVDTNLDEDQRALEAGRSLLQSDSGLDGIEDMAESLVLAIVSSWSYGEVSVDVLDTMPDAAVDAIYTKAVADDYIAKLMPDFGPNPDRDSPTTP